MNKLCFWQRIAFALAIFPIAVSAQSKTEDPADPSAVVSTMPYKSAFADYQAYKDPELIPWRKSNEAVRTASEVSGRHSMESMPMQMPKATSPTPTPAHSMPNMPAMDIPKKMKEQ